MHKEPVSNQYNNGFKNLADHIQKGRQRNVTIYKEKSTSQEENSEYIVPRNLDCQLGYTHLNEKARLQLASKSMFSASNPEEPDSKILDDLSVSGISTLRASKKNQKKADELNPVSFQKSPPPEEADDTLIIPNISGDSLTERIFTNVCSNVELPPERRSS